MKSKASVTTASQSSVKIVNPDTGRVVTGWLSTDGGRRDYECEWCAAPLPRGTRHYYFTAFFTFRLCLDCVAAR